MRPEKRTGRAGAAGAARSVASDSRGPRSFLNTRVSSFAGAGAGPAARAHPHRAQRASRTPAHGPPNAASERRRRHRAATGEGAHRGGRPQPEPLGGHAVRQLVRHALAPRRRRRGSTVALLGDRDPRGEPRGDLEVEPEPLDRRVDLRAASPRAPRASRDPRRPRGRRARTTARGCRCPAAQRAPRAGAAPSSPSAVRPRTMSSPPSGRSASADQRRRAGEQVGQAARRVLDERRAGELELDHQRRVGAGHEARARRARDPRRGRRSPRRRGPARAAGAGERAVDRRADAHRVQARRGRQLARRSPPRPRPRSRCGRR